MMQSHHDPGVLPAALSSLPPLDRWVGSRCYPETRVLNPNRFRGSDDEDHHGMRLHPVDTFAV